jgi:hypothetical protein
MKSFAYRLLFAFALLAPSTLGAQENQNLRFGLPSPAKSDNAQREDFLIERPAIRAQLQRQDEDAQLGVVVFEQRRHRQIHARRLRSRSASAKGLRQAENERLQRQRLRPWPHVSGAGSVEQASGHGRHVFHDERPPAVAELQPTRLGTTGKLLPHVDQGPCSLHLLRTSRRRRRGKEWCRQGNR